MNNEDAQAKLEEMIENIEDSLKELKNSKNGKVTSSVP